MAFYSALLDVPVTPIQEEIRFAMLRHDGNNAAACLGPMDKYHQPGHSGPLIYLATGDRLQEAEQLVPKIGGRVLEPLHSIGSGHGSRVIIEDTEGNWLALYAPPPPEQGERRVWMHAALSPASGHSRGDLRVALFISQPASAERHGQQSNNAQVPSGQVDSDSAKQ